MLIQSQLRQIVHKTLSRKQPITRKIWWSSSRYRPWVQAPVLQTKNFIAWYSLLFFFLSWRCSQANSTANVNHWIRDVIASSYHACKILNFKTLLAGQREKSGTRTTSWVWTWWMKVNKKKKGPVRFPNGTQKVSALSRWVHLSVTSHSICQSIYLVNIRSPVIDPNLALSYILWQTKASHRCWKQPRPYPVLNTPPFGLLDTGEHSGFYRCLLLFPQPL
jgi:hypothetical protein